MINLILDIVSWILLLTGSIFVLIGAFGILRLPDFYTRLHAAGLTDTMGAGLVLLGLLLQAETFTVGIKLVIIGAFLLFTSPTTSHATARAALAAGQRIWQAPRIPKQAENGTDGDGAA